MGVITIAFFGTTETTQKYEKVSEQSINDSTVVKYKNGKHNITIIFNQPSDVALKRFANTLNDIVTDIANKRASA